MNRSTWVALAALIPLISGSLALAQDFEMDRGTEALSLRERTLTDLRFNLVNLDREIVALLGTETIQRISLSDAELDRQLVAWKRSVSAECPLPDALATLTVIANALPIVSFVPAFLSPSDEVEQCDPNGSIDRMLASMAGGAVVTGVGWICDVGSNACVYINNQVSFNKRSLAWNFTRQAKDYAFKPTTRFKAYLYGRDSKCASALKMELPLAREKAFRQLSALEAQRD